MQVAEDANEPTPGVPYKSLPIEDRIALAFPEIEERMADGETLTGICRFARANNLNPDGRLENGRILVERKPQTFPTRMEVYGWMETRPELAQRFARARALWAEALQDEMQMIADDRSRDYVMTEGGLQLDREHISRSKVRIYARKVLLARARIARDTARQEVIGEMVASGQTAQEPIMVIGVEPTRGAETLDAEFEVVPRAGGGDL